MTGQWDYSVSAELPQFSGKSGCSLHMSTRRPSSTTRRLTFLADEFQQLLPGTRIDRITGPGQARELIGCRQRGDKIRRKVQIPDPVIRVRSIHRAGPGSSAGNSWTTLIANHFPSTLNTRIRPASRSAPSLIRGSPIEDFLTGVTGVASAELRYALRDGELCPR